MPDTIFGWVSEEQKNFDNLDKRMVTLISVMQNIEILLKDMCKAHNVTHESINNMSSALATTSEDVSITKDKVDDIHNELTK
jgi:hypothetical protein